MDKPHKIAQIYGYAACLIAVITFLCAVVSIVNAVVDRTSPFYAEGQYGRYELASYDIYRVDILKGWDSSKVGPIPNDKTLKAMYESARQDARETANFGSRKSIITNGLLLLISVLLFLGHWTWLRKLSGSA